MGYFLTREAFDGVVAELGKRFRIFAPVRKKGAGRFTDAIMKRIKKDMNSFIASSTFNSKFGPKAYNDGSELAYLLLEWDADRFAADNVVGKHIMGSALTDRFKRQFDIMWKDPTEDQKLTTDFNLDRMHLRTINI